MKNENYFIRWTGKLVPDMTGEYEISFTGDDGYRLYLDNKLMLDDWHDQGPTKNSFKMQMTAGKAYDIKIEITRMEEAQ